MILTELFREYFGNLKRFRFFFKLRINFSKFPIFSFGLFSFRFEIRNKLIKIWVNFSISRIACFRIFRPIRLVFAQIFSRSCESFEQG